MIIGNIHNFAIEYQLSELYENDFIGNGKFLVYINDAVFGKNDLDSTTFSGIIPELGKRTLVFKKSNNKILDLNPNVLAFNFYDSNYGENQQNNYSDLSISEFSQLLLLDNLNWNAMDEAFDDGSYVLQVNRSIENIELIGFKSISTNPTKITDLKVINISYSEYSDVINKFIKSIKNDFIKVYGHGEELNVFNWWKKT